MWSSSSRIVIALPFGTSPGSQRSTGSSMSRRPSASSCSTTVATNVLVTLAIRKPSDRAHRRAGAEVCVAGRDAGGTGPGRGRMRHAPGAPAATSRRTIRCSVARLPPASGTRARVSRASGGADGRAATIAARSAFRLQEEEHGGGSDGHEDQPPYVVAPPDLNFAVHGARKYGARPRTPSGLSLNFQRNQGNP